MQSVVELGPRQYRMLFATFLESANFIEYFTFLFLLSFLEDAPQVYIKLYDSSIRHFDPSLLSSG